ncbi:PAS domain-containing protein [Arcobacter sp. YIC-464]|uniref:PAS domain-containing protein n=1 Tax=Arcobacter sp. YIC-464 TaxID=3376631 RepID=UPI003C2A785E
MNKEIKLSKDTMIVSETNTKGKIIYANDDFCKIAGFTKNEIIGKHHNVVRHEDMPKEAFKDLWETIKRGQTWKGIVKNSTKDGRYYWVNATAYAVKKRDGKTRYISVRVKPTVEEVNRAKELYKQMKSRER